MKKLLSVLSISALGLTACGGGGGGSSSEPAVILDGVFKDSNVSGLSYESGDQKGITDSAGKFRYEQGTGVRFSLGGIDLGTATGKEIVTPIDLVASGNLGSAEVINRVRLLMMLDNNSDPSDGIVISSAIQEIAKDWSSVNFSSTNFLSEVSTISAEASAADSVAHTLPTTDEATAHMRTTLLCSYSGGFVGKWSGSDKSGNVVFVVDPRTGKLNGSAYDSESQASVDMTATSPINYDSTFDFVSTDTEGKQFSGKLISTDSIQGNWKDTQAPTIKGDFSAQRQAGDSKSVFRYSAIFTGSNKGIMTFDIDNENRVDTHIVSVKDQSVVSLIATIEDTKLVGKVENGIEINAVIDKTKNTVQGVWTNLHDLTTGTLTGSGCRLN